MEEFRDERLSRIMSWMQAWARGYLTRKIFKKLQEQRLALTVVQRSLRRYLKLRTWPWWKLWQKVKPLLNASRVEDQIAVSISPDAHPIRSSTQHSLWFNFVFLDSAKRSSSGLLRHYFTTSILFLTCYICLTFAMPLHDVYEYFKPGGLFKYFRLASNSE